MKAPNGVKLDKKHVIAVAFDGCCVEFEVTVANDEASKSLIFTLATILSNQFGIPVADLLKCFKGEAAYDYPVQQELPECPE